MEEGIVNLAAVPLKDGSAAGGDRSRGAPEICVRRGTGGD